MREKSSGVEADLDLESFLPELKQMQASSVTALLGFEGKNLSLRLDGTAHVSYATTTSAAGHIAAVDVGELRVDRGSSTPGQVDLAGEVRLRVVD